MLSSFSLFENIDCGPAGRKLTRWSVLRNHAEVERTCLITRAYSQLQVTKIILASKQTTQTSSILEPKSDLTQRSKHNSLSESHRLGFGTLIVTCVAPLSLCLRHLRRPTSLCCAGTSLLWLSLHSTIQPNILVKDKAPCEHRPARMAREGVIEFGSQSTECG